MAKRWKDKKVQNRKKTFSSVILKKNETNGWRSHANGRRDDLSVFFSWFSSFLVSLRLKQSDIDECSIAESFKSCHNKQD